MVFQYLGEKIVRDDSSGSKRFVLRNGWQSIDANKFKYIDSNKIVTENDDKPIWFTTDFVVEPHDENAGFKILTECYDGVKEQIKTSKIQINTALHIACQIGAIDIVKILLTHPDVKTDIKNYKNEVPKDCITRGFEDIIKLEFKKAQKGKKLLNVLSCGNFHEAKVLLNQELNPNCWKRNFNGEIETPLSLIIKSCLQGITEDNEELLTKLLKHKELDFSQTKPITAIEQSPQVKQIIERAMKERLTNAINRKDLDDVKKLVEDNCFINRAIITDALRNVNESIHHLNEKFPAIVEQPSANAHNVAPEINDEFIAQELQRLENLEGELERIKTQLREKEQELNKAVSERTVYTDKILQLERGFSQERLELQAQNRDLKSKNRKLSEASIYNRRQSDYASASFVLSGAFAFGACLTISNLEICISLAVAAFVFIAIGCYCSYKVITVLSDVTSTEFGNVVSLGWS